MDYKDAAIRNQLSGSKGLDIVNESNSDSSYHEHVILFTNALVQEAEINNEVRTGLAENLCRLILRQSKLSTTTAASLDDIDAIQKANDLIQETVAIILSSRNNNVSSNFVECFFNVARKPNMPNNYCWYIPALTITFQVLQKSANVVDVLEASRMSKDSFAEDEWRTNLTNLLPKRLFALPTGHRPSSVPALKLCLPLLVLLNEQDFHSGFGKVIPFQLQRFPKDTFESLASLCNVLRMRKKDDVKIVVALEFHFSQGMNFSTHVMKHLSTGNMVNQSSAVRLCSEYVFLNPERALEMVTNALGKHIGTIQNESDGEMKQNFYKSLTDIANRIHDDVDKTQLLPNDKLSNGVETVVKGIQSLPSSDDAQLQAALEAWNALLGSSSGMAAAVAKPAVFAAAAIASKPGAVSSSSCDSKIQQKIPTSAALSKPGVYAAGAGASPESSKIKIDQGASKPGSAISESRAEGSSKLIAHKIATEGGGTAKPGAVAESRGDNSAINRKIQTDGSGVAAKSPGVIAERSNDSAINRKIQTGGVAVAAASRPGSVVAENAAESAVQRKILSEGPGVIVESRNDTAIKRKIQQAGSSNPATTAPPPPYSSQPGAVSSDVHNIDSNINRKIAQGTTAYHSNDPGAKGNQQQNGRVEHRKSDLSEDTNAKMLVVMNEAAMDDKHDKLIEETVHRTERDAITDAQEFRHQVTRNRKEKKKREEEKKKGKLIQPGWDDQQNLAVAVAIEDDDDFDSEYDPIFAEEYDPDYKPKIYKNPRVMSRICCCLVIIISCVTAVIVTFTKQAVYEPEPTSAPTPAPTMAPTSVRDTLGIDEFISTYFGYSFNSTTIHFEKEDLSPYEINRRLAMNWIINIDQLEISLTDYNNLIQRYVLILLYLSTNGDHWKDCNGNDGYDFEYMNNNTDFNDTDTTEDESTIDRQIRRWLYQQESGDMKSECNYTDFEGYPYTYARWTSPKSECEWFGVMCNDDNEIQQLLLHSNSLVGTIPPEISKLPYLYRFWVNDNSINGNMPSEIGTMQHLADLQVHGNKMDGSIPDELFDLSTLQALNLAFNDFTGTISAKYSQLTNLKGLYLFHNHFSGTIPDEIGNLPYLAFAWLQYNLIEGSIPATVGKLSKLLQFSVSFNQMDGKIPPEIADASNLEALLLENNKFTGTIPEELYTLTNMKTLFLQTNKFSGTISDDIGKLTLAEKVILRENLFEGTIPSVIGQLGNLNNLWVHFNNFEGAIPNEICTMFKGKKTSPWVLYADCDDQMGNSAIECDCCTDCCDNVLHLCYKE